MYINPHRRLPQAFAHKPNKEKRKESQLPCCASTHSTTASRLSCLSRLAPLVPRASRASRLSCLAPLVPRASRASRLSCLASTCASLQRALLGNVRFHNVHLPLRLSSTLLCAASQAASLSHKSTHRTLTCASQHVLSERFLHSDLSLSSNSLSCGLLKLSTHNLTALRPALFWARCIRVRQSGGHATPPPAASRFRNRPMMSLRSGGPRGRFWRETSPRPRRVSIRPAGHVTTRCTFDGECRWWCCVVGEVASSRAWCMSVEYDVSLEALLLVHQKNKR